MTTSFQGKVLCSEMVEQIEDTRSTSASGSDSEVEKKLLLASSSDSEVETKQVTGNDSPLYIKPGLPPPNSFVEVGGDKAAVSGWVAKIAALLRCPNRSSKVQVEVSKRPASKKQVSYDRCTLLQCRPTPGSQTDKQDVLPRTMRLLPGKPAATPLAGSSTMTLLPGAQPTVGYPPSVQLPPGLAMPPGFGGPPGLWTSPPGTSGTTRQQQHQGSRGVHRNNVAGQKQAATPTEKSAPVWPQEIQEAVEPEVPKVYNAKNFRKEIVTIMKDLSSDWNVGKAVRRVRAENVPKERQAEEFSDILTRAAEERRGVTRRLSFAFAAGLGAADVSCFDKNECSAGMGTFFQDVYPDLCDEVPRLRSIIAHELVPTLRSVFPANELSLLLPDELRKA